MRASIYARSLKSLLWPTLLRIPPLKVVCELGARFPRSALWAAVAAPRGHPASAVRSF